MSDRHLPITVRICQGCGVAFEGKGRAKWHSDRCRKRTLYGGTCEDCGAPTTGTSNGVDRAPRWCKTCAPPHQADIARVWTRELIVARIVEWDATYGEPPAGPDWMPWTARNRLHDEARARRFEEAGGYWPSTENVHRIFGSWSAALQAAGFAARPPHGGGGNELRHRSVRELAA